MYHASVYFGVTLALSDFNLVHFKLAVLAYKSLHDWLPYYLAEDCQLVAVTGRRQLRLSDIDTCQVRRTNTQFGDRSFAAAGPRTWNSLPIHLRDSELSLEQFRRSLKTHLYKHYIRLLAAAAPSDSVFRALGTN